MRQTSVAQPATITRQHVGTALRAARLNAAHNRRQLNAVNRAALNLEACRWYRQPDGVLVMESAQGSGTFYHVDGPGCDCPAHGVCWHASANDLLLEAATLAATPARPRMTDDQYAAACAACDDLF